MKYGIVTDSGCDLKDIDLFTKKEIDFSRAPLKLQVGDEVFVDDFNLDISHFMEVLAAYKGKTGSAAPSPQEWMDAYIKSDEIFVITITGTLSGSYASAKVAKDMFMEQYPEKKIHLIDSLSTGGEVTLLVQKLIELIEEELPFEKIVEEIESYHKEHTRLLFILEHMENLVKNGRVGKVAGSIAGVLGIRILGRASDEGTLDLLHKCRGKMTVYDKTIEEMYKRGYHGGRIAISHCFNEKAARYIEKKIQEKYPNVEISLIPTSGLCSYYSEKNGVLVGYEV